MAEAVQIGEFVLESLLGEGGMGRVFRARQVALDRWVALKILQGAKENQAFIERFYREAKSAARLVHPNIIQIYTVREHEGIPYYAMEYVEGEDIEHLLRPDAGDAFTFDEVLEITRSVAKALALATEHGIVHRDIKPANIMVSKSGLVKVMDFGLAKGIATDHAMTQQGLIVGTPAYMSPEQGASKPVDARSDQYSLGCVLYECICRRPPFKADNVASLIFKHMYEAPEPIAKARPDVPPALDIICMRMMAKTPEERYQTPEELLEALAGVPSNASIAEVALSKRVSKLLKSKKQKSDANRTALTPRGLGFDVPPPPAPVVAPPPARPAQLGAPAAAAKAPPAPLRAEVQAESARAAAATVAQTPAPAPRVAPATPTPMPRPAPAFATPRPGSSPRIKAAGSSVKLGAAPKVHESFLKLADGRWSYKVEMGRCTFAEGLAQEMPAPANQKTEGLGDCLLCNNWNKRVGCALAFSQELESRFRGMRLCSEQAIGWSGAGRFDKAILLLDNYVKSNPEDPEGYRELARLYDRPEYKGKDKRRGIVLYSRFIELARKTGGYSAVEIGRAEERVTALRSAPADMKSSASFAVGIPFQAFYRGVLLCFCYGNMTRERLVLVRAGEVDPETGIQSSDMGSAVTKAVSVFRLFKSEQARRDEQTAVRKELLRLAGLPPETLHQDPACVLSLPYDDLADVKLDLDTAVNIRTVSITTKDEHVHQILFTEAGAFRADQCHLLIRRKLGRA